MTNSGLNNNRHIWFYFKNNTIGESTQDYLHYGETYALNVSGNLNPNYLPRPDTQTIDGEEISYTTSMCFKHGDGRTMYNTGFTEIIGWGPIVVKEGSNILLEINYVNPSIKGGYSGPRIWGKELLKNTYADENNLQAQKSNGHNINLFLSKGTAEKLYALFDESEYRIYLPKKINLRFYPVWVSSVVLPRRYKFNKLIVALDKIVNILDSTPKKLIPVTSKVLLKTGCVVDTSSRKQGITELPDKLLYLLSRFVTVAQHYYKTAIEWTDTEIVEDDSYLLKDNETLAHETAAELAGGVAALRGHKRYLVPSSRIFPDLNQAEVVSYTRADKTKIPPSVVAPISLTGSKTNTEMTRVGAEVIIIGRVSGGKKAVLFVRNPKKADFFELPGGGLNSQSDTYSSILTTKLELKCGFRQEQYNILKDTGYGLVINERKTAQDKYFKNTFPLSYYKLFYTVYYPYLEDLKVYTGFSFDNREVVKKYNIPNEPGYTARLMWVLVDDLELNPGITTRYSELIPLIKEIAKNINF